MKEINLDDYVGKKNIPLRCACTGSPVVSVEKKMNGEFNVKLKNGETLCFWHPDAIPDCEEDAGLEFYDDKTFNALDYRKLIDEHESAKRKILSNCGWKEDCSNPSSIWLWRKTLQGKEYCCNTDTALRLEVDNQEFYS